MAIPDAFRNRAQQVGFLISIGHPTLAEIASVFGFDFIVIDGAEGGTGAAPVEFPDHVGMPLVEGLSFVHNALVGTNLRDGVRLGASGKVTNGFSMAKMLSLGADWCNAGRAFMFTLGCVQSQRCHTDTCPTGITTQDPMRQRAISVEYRAQRVANYHAETLKVLAGLVASAGLDTPNDLKPYHLYRRMGPAEIESADTAYNWLAPGQLLDAPEDTPFAQFWRMADADQFAPKQ
jgi:glutamate synthase domain-containing protein 2